MQEMQKKRNSSEPRPAKDSSSSRSKPRKVFSASDARDVFGAKKKHVTTGVHDDDSNTLRGLSKRFDRLSAKFDDDRTMHDGAQGGESPLHDGARGHVVSFHFLHVCAFYFFLHLDFFKGLSTYQLTFGKGMLYI